MSLDYDLTEVKDRDTSDAGWDVTQAVILRTLTVGIGELTEKTAPEFYARQAFVAKMDGVTALTCAQIRAHIGLKTNVFPQLTRAQFMRRFVFDLDNSVREYRTNAIMAGADL